MGNLLSIVRYRTLERKTLVVNLESKTKKQETTNLEILDQIRKMETIVETELVPSFGKECLHYRFQIQRMQEAMHQMKKEATQIYISLIAPFDPVLEMRDSDDDDEEGYDLQ